MPRRASIHPLPWVAAIGVALAAAGCGRESSPPPRAEPFMVRPPLAGVSAHGEIEVDAIAPGDFGTDTAGARWHRFLHRCSGCHVAPSPGQHPSPEWDRVVDRMGRHMDSAGLLPLSERDAASIAKLLELHAAVE